MNVGHSNTYDGLARVAAAQTGLRPASPEACEKDDAGRSRRDVLWAEYDRMLSDEKTYSLRNLRDWLAEQGVHTSMSTVERNRRRLRDERRRRELANARVRDLIEATSGMNAEGLLSAAQKQGLNILFEMLMKMNLDGLQDLKVSSMLRAIELTGYLAKTRAETELSQQRLADLRKRFDDAVAAKSATRKDGRLTADEIGEIRSEVFGSAA